MTAQFVAFDEQVVDDAPNSTCARCGGRQAWQTYDGAVEECPACTAEDQPDPDACIRCDTVPDHALTYGGLCKSCDVEDALADGWVPSHTGVLGAGPR